MRRLIWALYVEREWVPGAEQLMGKAPADLPAKAYHQRNQARLAARRLMERLLLLDPAPTADVTNGAQ